MIKKQLLAKIITSTVTSILLGLLLILLPIILPVSRLIRIAFIVLGVVTIINYIPSLLAGLKDCPSAEGKEDLIVSIIGIAIGVVMIFYQGTLLTVLAAIFLIILPLIRILMTQNRTAAVRGELFRIILGIVLIAFLPALMGAVDTIVKVVLTVIGIMIIVCAVINGYNGYRVWKSFIEPNPNRAAEVFIDSTGDGVVDTIMVDTTGNGIADTELKYRPNKENKKK